MAVSVGISQGRSVLVDAEDFASVSPYRWHTCDGYAARTVRDPNGKRRTVYMHREILRPAAGMFADHVNGDRLDNRRANLRSCTKAENGANHGGQPSRRLSNYKGVRSVSRKKNNPWEARIRVAGRDYSLGFFGSDVEAARAYDAAAIEHFGSFARPNLIETNRGL